MVCYKKILVSNNLELDNFLKTTSWPAVSKAFCVVHIPIYSISIPVRYTLMFLGQPKKTTLYVWGVNCLTERTPNVCVCWLKTHVILWYLPVSSLEIHVFLQSDQLQHWSKIVWTRTKNYFSFSNLHVSTISMKFSRFCHQFSSCLHQFSNDCLSHHFPAFLHHFPQISTGQKQRPSRTAAQALRSRAHGTGEDLGIEAQRGKPGTKSHGWWSYLIIFIYLSVYICLCI